MIEPWIILIVQAIVCFIQAGMLYITGKISKALRKDIETLLRQK